MPHNRRASSQIALLLQTCVRMCTCSHHHHLHYLDSSTTRSKTFTAFLWDALKKARGSKFPSVCSIFPLKLTEIKHSNDRNYTSKSTPTRSPTELPHQNFGSLSSMEAEIGQLFQDFKLNESSETHSVQAQIADATRNELTQHANVTRDAVV